MDYVKNTRDERDRNQFTNRSVRFSAYKEDGGTLEKIFWYNAKENNYQGNSQPYNGAIRFDEIQSATNSKIKIDFNRKEMFSQAAGKYRIIPTINYYQDPAQIRLIPSTMRITSRITGIRRATRCRKAQFIMS